MLSKISYILMLGASLLLMSACSQTPQPSLIQKATPVDANEVNKANATDSSKIVIPSKSRRFKGVSIKENSLSSKKSSKDSCPDSANMKRIKGAMLG